MAERLPNYWNMEEYDTLCCCHGHLSQCKGLTTKFQHGIECYSLLVSVLATRNPHHIGHFMAYQRTIIKANWSTVVEDWSLYVRFLLPHKFVEMRESWFQPIQWNICRQSKSSIRFIHCSSVLHSSAACPNIPDSTNPWSGGSLRRAFHAK